MRADSRWRTPAPVAVSTIRSSDTAPPLRTTEIRAVTDSAGAPDSAISTTNRHGCSRPAASSAARARSYAAELK